MMESAVRARKWMLWAAPVMVLSGLFYRADGAGAALAAWILLGLIPWREKRRAQFYPGQRKMKFSRIYFGCSLSLLFVSSFTAAFHILWGMDHPLLITGAILMGLPVGAETFLWHVPRRLCLIGGIMMTAALLMLRQ